MLTEKEKAELVEIMSGVIKTQNATINGHFEAVKIELSYIKDKGDKTFDQATKTNGRVNKHDTEIGLLKSEKGDRISTCPQRDKIESLLNTQKNKKFRFVYDVVVVSVAFLAFYVSVLTFKDFTKEKISVQKNVTEIKAESKIDDKVQNININANRKAINDQNVDKAFEKSQEK